MEVVEAARATPDALPTASFTAAPAPETVSVTGEPETEDWPPEAASLTDDPALETASFTVDLVSDTASWAPEAVPWTAAPKELGSPACAGETGRFGTSPAGPLGPPGLPPPLGAPPGPNQDRREHHPSHHRLRIQSLRLA